jgi:hypothetical protein
MEDRYGEANKHLWQPFCECAKNVCLSPNMRQINLIYATTTVDQGLYWNLKAGKA